LFSDRFEGPKKLQAVSCDGDDVWQQKLATIASELKMVNGCASPLEEQSLRQARSGKIRTAAKDIAMVQHPCRPLVGHRCSFELQKGDGGPDPCTSKVA
jgi:hypothetical protein